MKISAKRLWEILAETFPSCGIYAAARMPDDAMVEVIATMTAGEWRTLSPDIVSEVKGLQT